MNPIYTFCLLAVALTAPPSIAAAKERDFNPVAGPDQEVRFSDGKAVLMTGNQFANVAVSYIPIDRKSAFIRVWIENASEQQFNVSETSLSASSAGSPLRVFTYAELVKQQKRREVWAAIATGIAAGANSYAASNAGYSNYSGTYQSHTNVGAMSTNTYGSYRGTSYNGGVAYLAQANAAAQNQAMFDRFQAVAADAARTLQDRTLKANTLLPGQSVFGDVKIGIPKASPGADMDLTINVGGQPLTLKFKEGPLQVDTAPRTVSVPRETAPTYSQEQSSSTTVAMPTAAAAAIAPPAQLAPSPAALSHPSGPAARVELQKLGCNEGFNLVSDAAGRAIFEGQCGVGGKRQLLECYGAGCRSLN